MQKIQKASVHNIKGDLLHYGKFVMCPFIPDDIQSGNLSKDQGEWMLHTENRPNKDRQTVYAPAIISVSEVVHEKNQLFVIMRDQPQMDDEYKLSIFTSRGVINGQVMYGNFGEKKISQMFCRKVLLDPDQCIDVGIIKSFGEGHVFDGEFFHVKVESHEDHYLLSNPIQVISGIDNDKLNEVNVKASNFMSGVMAELDNHINLAMNGLQNQFDAKLLQDLKRMAQLGVLTVEIEPTAGMDFGMIDEYHLKGEIPPITIQMTGRLKFIGEETIQEQRQIIADKDEQIEKLKGFLDIIAEARLIPKEALTDQEKNIIINNQLTKYYEYLKEIQPESDDE